MAGEGMDLIITSRRARADRRRPHRRGRRRVRRPRDGPRRGDARRRSPRSCAASPRAGSHFDPEAVREANRKQAIVPEGSIALDPVGTAPGLVVPRPDGQRGGRPARAAARAAADVADRDGDRAGRGGARAGDAAARLHAAHVRHPRVGDRQEPARDRGRGGRPAEVEITTCLRRGEIEIDVRYRDSAAETAEAVRGRPAASATPPRSSASTARRSTRRWRRCCERAPPRPGRVLQRRPAGGADHQPARRLGLHGRRRGRPTRTRPRRSCSASTRR